jgi:hypothetical protein
LVSCCSYLNQMQSGVHAAKHRERPENRER